MSTSPFLKFTMRSDPQVLGQVRKTVESFSTASGFNEKAVGEIGLCVNEAIANVIRHAYHGDVDQPIEVEVFTVADTLHVKIRDWGEGVEPAMVESGDKDPMQPGGLGLICMGRLMDKVTFMPQPVGMLLEMVKNR